MSAESILPTILRVDGFRFFFWSNEGEESPHIHETKAEPSAKFWLFPKVALVKSKNLSTVELRKLSTIVEDHQSLFLEKWNEHFSHE